MLGAAPPRSRSAKRVFWASSPRPLPNLDTRGLVYRYLDFVVSHLGLPRGLEPARSVAESDWARATGYRGRARDAEPHRLHTWVGIQRDRLPPIPGAPEFARLSEPQPSAYSLRSQWLGHFAAIPRLGPPRNVMEVDQVPGPGPCRSATGRRGYRVQRRAEHRNAAPGPCQTTARKLAGAGTRDVVCYLRHDLERVRLRLLVILDGWAEATDRARELRVAVGSG